MWILEWNIFLMILVIHLEDTDGKELVHFSVVEKPSIKFAQLSGISYELKSLGLTFPWRNRIRIFVLPKVACDAQQQDDISGSPKRGSVTLPEEDQHVLVSKDTDR